MSSFSVDSDPMAVLRKMQNQFQSKYKNYIAGSFDQTYASVLSLINKKDTDMIQSLRSRRTHATVSSQAIQQDSSLTDAQKAKKIANKEMSFMREATRIVKGADEKSAKLVMNAVANLTRELKTLTENYYNAVAGTDDGVVVDVGGSGGESGTGTVSDADIAFARSIRQVRLDLKQLVLEYQGKLRSEKVFFHVGAYRAKQYLEDIDNMTRNILSGNVTPTTTVTTTQTTDSGVDITV